MNILVCCAAESLTPFIKASLKEELYSAQVDQTHFFSSKLEINVTAEKLP